MSSNIDLIRGRQQVCPLTNKSGTTRVEGDVVIADTTADNSFTTTAVAGVTSVLGVVAESITDDSEGRVICAGWCPTLKVDAATARGDFLKTSTTATRATPVATNEEGCFAIALSTTVGVGTISAYIFASGGKGAAGAAGSGPAGILVLTAAGGWPSTTGGCATAVKTEYTTNDVDLYVLAFDKDTDEYAQWTVVMPSDWDAGTITAKFYWTSANHDGGDVIWGIQGISLGDDDAIDQAWGAAQTITDTELAANDLMISAATAAVTLAGTPAASEMVQFRAYRDADAGGDTHGYDALLIAIYIAYTRS